jgi:GNAT superfamily N-acetyltransferase
MRFPELSGGRRLSPLDAAAASELDALSLRCADFMRLVEGREPGPHDGREILTDAPPNFPLADKLVLSVRSGGGLIGVADVLRGYPEAAVWWIVLLLLAPEARGGGLGREVVEALSDWAAGDGAAALQLGVQSQNERALRFWRREGFEHIRSAEQQNGRLRNQVLVLERRLG